MFQRSIFRQAQAARSVISSSSPASQALRRTTQPRVPTIRAFAPQTTRYYSTEKEASEAQNGEAEKAENPLQKELDEKNKEVIELKVCHSSKLQSLHPQC
jgi:molecular chaperone GrpE